MKLRLFLAFLGAATVLTLSNVSHSPFWISAAHADTDGRSSLFDSKFKFKKKPQSGASNIYKQKKDAFEKRQKKIDSFRSQCEAKAKSSAELYDCSFSDGTTETRGQENPSRSPGPRRSQTSSTTTTRPASSTKRPASSTKRPASSTTRPASSTQSTDSKSTNSNSTDSLDTNLDKMIDDIYSDVLSN